jgi:hypothetical protein
LIVDANRKLSRAVASERFQSVTRQCRQIGQARRCLEPVKTHLSLSREARELLDVSSGGKLRGSLVPIADNHGDGITGFTIYVNSKPCLSAKNPAFSKIKIGTSGNSERSLIRQFAQRGSGDQRINFIYRPVYILDLSLGTIVF